MNANLFQLFIGFAIISLQGFGGVLPWVRRSVVDKHQWLDAAEFNTLLGLCQLMPGPNVVNLSVCIGYKLRGLSGAITCVLGLTVPPMILIIILANLYQAHSSLPAIGGVLAGVSAVGIGLIAATGIKMLKEVFKKPIMLITVGVIISGIAIFKLSMLNVVFIGFILAIALAYIQIRKVSK